MTTYFGILPSEDLKQDITEIQALVDNQPDTELYPYRDKVTKKVTHELIENLLNGMVKLIQVQERKDKMQKLIHNIDGAIDTLLNHVLLKLPNEKVMDSFNFLTQESLFIDNDGNQRVGFKLDDETATTLLKCFTEAKTSDTPHQHLQTALDSIIQRNLEHFLIKFCKTLHLGMLKRGTIPIAEAAVNKASQAAIHKLLPELQLDACERLNNHFSQFIVTKN